MKEKTTKILIFTVLTVMLAILSIAALWAYYSSLATPKAIRTEIEINELFARLDSKKGSPTTTWGASASDPYVISNEKYLKNLYLLQNVRSAENGHNAFGMDTYFQVSETDGRPLCVGGTAGELFAIPSIGSEDYPFIANLRGVTGAAYELPSGEMTDTSAFANIKVTGYAGQIDIGLFGNIGRAGPTLSGSISNLLLSDVQIETTSAGGSKTDHPDYFVASNHEGGHETNHIGILAGHADNCLILNISVYYSSTGTDADGNPVSDIKAFDIDTSGAKYTSAGGIIGFYKDIVVSDEDYPVSSESNYNQEKFGGGNTVGTGAGMMFSEDIWTDLGGDSLTENSYDLQASFGSELYSDVPAAKTYFRKGVFTFVHSGQTTGNDKIAKLWTEEDDISKFYVADNYIDTTKRQTSFSYTYSRVTDISQISVGNYYMLAAPVTTEGTSGGIASGDTTSMYAFIRVGATNVGAAEIEFSEDNSRIIIPGDINEKSMFDNYVGERISYRESNTNCEGLAYGNSGTTYYMTMSRASGNWLYFTTSIQGSYTNRIFFNEYMSGYTNAANPGTSTDTFFVTSYSAWYKYMNFYQNGLYFEATDRPTAQARAQNFYSSNNIGNGVTGGQPYNDKIYVYQIDKDSETEIVDRSLYIAEAPEDADEYEMSEHVLFYDKTRSEGANPQPYSYDLIAMENLGWANDKQTVITKADKALYMADNIDYNTYYDIGLTSGLVGNETSTRLLPMGSIAFQVQGTNIPGDIAKINIIVATNPTQLINQTFACYDLDNYDYGNGWGASSTQGMVDSFKLPPVPGATKNTTTPINVREVSSLELSAEEEAALPDYRTAYVNLNTVLVAYTIELSCTDTKTFLLGADFGTATFVYFDVDSVAASNTRNPDHENMLFFNVLDGIDFVFKTASGMIATVTGSSYVQSLIMPYIGMETDTPDDPTDQDAGIVISDCYKLTYSIYRHWNGYYGEIYIYAEGPPPVPVDYSECTDKINNKQVYSDKVYIGMIET